jgi:hypothetical protein
VHETVPCGVRSPATAEAPATPGAYRLRCSVAGLTAVRDVSADVASTHGINGLAKSAAWSTAGVAVLHNGPRSRGATSVSSAPNPEISLDQAPLRL